jgi:hypothetical protein
MSITVRLLTAIKPWIASSIRMGLGVMAQLCQYLVASPAPAEQGA